MILVTVGVTGQSEAGGGLVTILSMMQSAVKQSGIGVQPVCLLCSVAVKQLADGVVVVGGGVIEELGHVSVPTAVEVPVQHSGQAVGQGE